MKSSCTITIGPCILYKTKNIFHKMLKDVGIEVPLSIKTRYSMQAKARDEHATIRCVTPFSKFIDVKIWGTYVVIVACYHPLPLPACCTLFLCFVVLQFLHPSTFF